MENEHQGIPNEVEPQTRLGPGLASVLTVVALASISVQLVLFLKSVVVDSDIAIAGFSLFFLALFGLAYYLVLKRALPKAIFLSSVICPLAICFIGWPVLFFGFSTSLEQSLLIVILSLALLITLSAPPALISKGRYHEK